MGQIIQLPESPQLDSYNRQKARKLVDRLVTAIGNRSRRILSRLFDHLEQQFCESWRKKIKRLETECERLEKDECYMPLVRDLKGDYLRDQVYAALANGPKTKKELARMFGRTHNAVLAVGQHLRHSGLVEVVSIDGRFMWARVGTAPPFVLARDAIIAALKQGSMKVSELATKTGKAEGTIVHALQSHLLPNNEVIRTKRGIYALPGRGPRYVSTSDAIVAALKKGPMKIQELIQETGTTPVSLPQFLRFLLAKGKVIRTNRGIYALPGATPAYVTTDDAIIRALTGTPMRLRALVQHINKSQNIGRAETTIIGALAGLKRIGTVKQGEWGGEYHLARPVRTSHRGARNGAPAR